MTSVESDCDVTVIWNRLKTESLKKIFIDFRQQ